MDQKFQGIIFDLVGGFSDSSKRGIYLHTSEIQKKTLLLSIIIILVV